MPVLLLARALEYFALQLKNAQHAELFRTNKNEKVEPD